MPYVKTVIRGTLMAVADARDGRSGNTVLLRQRLTAPVGVRLPQDVAVRVVGQFAGLKTVDQPTLTTCIVEIVGLCTKKQMTRANAWWDIAVMQDEQAVRNQAVRQYPCNSMRVEMMLFAVTPDGKLSVADGVHRGGQPEPTVVTICLLVHLRPEPRHILGRPPEPAILASDTGTFNGCYVY